MNKVLRILFIEDSEDDTLLEVAQIKKSGYEIEYKRVETAEKMKAAIREKTWDIILSDYKMPHFSGIKALTILKESCIDIPFLVVSGAIGEEVAVEAMKAGAHDYIMKNNLKRLLPAIERELRESKSRAERKLLEQKQKQSEKDRLANLQFFESMDQVNRAIQSSGTLEQMMSDALESILTIFNCDRAFLLYPCDPEAVAWKVPMERNKPEYPGAFELGLEIPMDPEVSASFRLLLDSDNPVKFGPGSIYPLPRDISNRFGFKSFMAMAIHPKVGKPWQFGIHQCLYERLWTTEEERLLKEIGRRLTDALTSLLAFRDLQNSENRYRRITEGLTDYQFTVQLKNGRPTETKQSPACTAVTGYTPEEFIANPYLWLQMVAPEDRDLVLERVQQILDGKDIPPIEHRIIRKDGSVRWVSDTTILMKDASGQLLSYDGVIKDITESKKVQESLWESSQMLKLVMENMPSFVFWKDRNSVYLGCNHLFAANAGLSSPKDIIGLTDFDLPWKNTEAESYRADDRMVMETGISKLNYEETQLTADGRVTGVRTSKIPLRNVADEIIGVLGTFEDITESKIAELQLIESEQKFRSLAEGSPDNILRYDADCRLVYVNRNMDFTERLNLSSNIGKTPLESDDFQSMKDYSEKLQEVINTGQPDELEIVIPNHNGESRTYHIRFVAERNNEGKIIGALAIGSDITERKQVEELVKERQKFIETILNLSPDILYIFDIIKGENVYSNDGLQTILGYSVSEIWQMGAQLLSTLMHPDDFKTYLEEIYPKYAVLKDNEAVVYQFRMKHKNDNWVWLDFNEIIYVRETDGTPRQIFGVAHDITVHKLAETKIKNSLKEKEVLLREIHHRVKNNFQIITSLLNLQADTFNDEKITNIFRDIHNRIKSMSLIHELIYKADDFNYLSVQNYIRRLIEHLRLSYCMQERLITISSDISNMEMQLDDLIPIGLILNELISNAFKHAFPDQREGSVFIGMKKESDDKYELVIRDDGKGLPTGTDFKNRKSLGLFLVQTLVKQIDGELTISNLEPGTEFKIWFGKR